MHEQGSECRCGHKPGGADLGVFERDRASVASRKDGGAADHESIAAERFGERRATYGRRIFSIRQYSWFGEKLTDDPEPRAETICSELSPPVSTSGSAFD